MRQHLAAPARTHIFDHHARHCKARTRLHAHATAVCLLLALRRLLPCCFCAFAHHCTAAVWRRSKAATALDAGALPPPAPQPRKRRFSPMPLRHLCTEKHGIRADEVKYSVAQGASDQSGRTTSPLRARARQHMLLQSVRV
mmetsp:Transcript_17305/g.48608  ORF Transcript_17305/g.48608 Transcript_17305/m.48608 type:complete len:141 (+) Transcript_17305:153-575(+)|eukprot:scaffold233225_cov31-Tisochrysis_lutea.AAC.1